jgi:beta-galactosidase
VLSHLNGVRHGSHGDLLEFSEPLPPAVLEELKAGKPLVLRLIVPEGSRAGGLALFGADTGMFPLDPTIELTTEGPLPAALVDDPAQPVAIDRVVTRTLPLLPTGESRAGAATWAYTTEEPAEGWIEPGFDDSAWARGRAGFGTRGTPGIRVGTDWSTPRIFLRGTFDLPELAAADQVFLRLYHDEDVTVWVNGKRLLARDGYVTSYEDIPLSAEQRALLQPGANSFAIECRQSGGGQGVDLGLTLRRQEQVD